MKRLLTLFLVALFAKMLCLSQTERLYTSDKLSSNLITCICQDKAGYIWIGTEYGLNKFDGYRFTNYLHKRNDSSSLLDNVVVSMFVDHSGNLFVGTNKGICKYNYRDDCFDAIKDLHQESPRVSEIIQAHNGTILAGTAGYGLYKVDDKSMSMQQIGKYKINSTSNYFSRLFEDKYNHLWKGSNYEVISRYSSITSSTKVHNYISSYGNPVSFLKDSKNNMIAVCQIGILKYDRKSDSLVPWCKLTGNNGLTFKSAICDKNDNIYIGTTGNGLWILRKGSYHIQRIESTNKSFDLNSAYTKTICEDRQHNLWVGCYRKGLLFLPRNKAQFSSWSFSAQNFNIGSSVSSLCSGDNGCIWCTVQNNGVYQFNSSGKIISHPSSPAGTSLIYRDHDGSYWLGSNNALYNYHPQTGLWKKTADIKGESINCITGDGHGTLYISAYGNGFYTYNKSSGKYTNLNMFTGSSNNQLCNNWILNMKIDSHGLLWIGTSNGASVYSPQRKSFRPLGWKNILSLYICYSFCEYGPNNMLIGSNEGLYIYNHHTGKTKIFAGSEPLRDKIISGIVTDDDGDIWCSTSMGIWQYQKNKRRFISYVNGNGLAAREYPAGACLHNCTGRIYLGTSDGITSFHPALIKKGNGKIGNVILTNLMIGGKSVNCTTQSNGDIVTKYPINESDHFEVSYLDNSFSMEFSLLDYCNSENIIFEYRINGTDKWSSTEEGKNSIIFNHLPPGYYSLEVRACYNGNYSPIKMLHIVITAPWYQSNFAFFIYILILLGITAFVIYSYNRKKHAQLYEEKMQFLINATHDIRSPLTLILSPLHKLMKRNIDAEATEELTIIDRNAQRILQLVNQILDIRKFDKNQMRLRCQRTDLIDFTNGVCKNFEYRAKEGGYNFTFHHTEKQLYAWIDRSNFEKVITNLLSNSFKYTPDGGNISISISLLRGDNENDIASNFFEIKVIDNGIGIKEVKMEKIFERFYQSNNVTSTNAAGTGIGLNLCKMIVGLHHGSISAGNNANGHGTCFTVRIPYGKSHLDENEIIDEEESKENVIRTSSGIKKKRTNSRYRILVVDDDEEIGNYISTELSEFFKFSVCKNGNEALAELLKTSYDLVISDVVMPGMDGFTLVRTIKGNSNISHIPVILLTSKSDIDNRLEGIEKGADSFLSKPFNLDELHVTINTLINNMLRLKGKFSGAQEQADKLEKKEIKSNDDLLMERIMKVINRNISNSDFNVDKLTDEVGISRAQLHRKMKEMTGIPASEFIRNLRLDQAAQLLREHKVNVTQVAYSVGFSNQAHFSTVFHKHFGASPSEYVESHDGVTEQKDIETQKN
jgi:signal transduction histidine kinase/ligand-binding sensor domain-containing protein/DNA-binding response OmpR family regulator